MSAFSCQCVNWNQLPVKFWRFKCSTFGYSSCVRRLWIYNCIPTCCKCSWDCQTNERMGTVWGEQTCFQWICIAVTCSCWSSEYISLYIVVRVSSTTSVSKEYGERKQALLNTMTGVRTLCIIERLVELRLAWQIWHLLVCGHGGEAHTSYKLHSCSAHSVSVFPFCRQNRTQHM